MLRSPTLYQSHIGIYSLLKARAFGAYGTMSKKKRAGGGGERQTLGGCLLGVVSEANFQSHGLRAGSWAPPHSSGLLCSMIPMLSLRVHGAPC
jgi:hypothetical protein